VPTDHPLQHIALATPELFPIDDPLRPLRAMVEAAFRCALGHRADTRRSRRGAVARTAIAGVAYGRSKQQLMEHLDYNLLFRWFVSLTTDGPVWDVTVFTKNRERLARG
jgi:hypothetical protein